MSRKLVSSLFAVVAAVALVGSACGDDDGDDSAGDTTETTEAAAARGNVDGTLAFGQLAPQTGSLNVIVDSLTTPVQIAVDEINDAGGVLGKDVTVTVADDGTDNANTAQTSYGKLINTDKVDVILGPASSSVVAKLTDGFGTDKVPACTGSATAASLTDTGDGYFFRTAPPDKLQGAALATLIAGDNHTKVAILARNDDYGVGFSEFLSAGLEDSGITVTETVLYNPDGANFDGDVQKALASSPEAVAVIGFNDDGAKVISSMIAQGAGPAQTPTYTADGMQGSKFAGTVDPSDPSKVAGIKGTAPAASPSGIESPFQATFAEAGVDPIFSSYYYDCTILMALAAVAADSDDGAAISEAFAANLSGDTDCNTFKDCSEALAAGETIHYRGASNDFEKWATMEPATGAYEVWSYDANGEVVTEPADQQIKIS
jgi:branched-chain amino acid transport system substrate-binding protein